MVIRSVVLNEHTSDCDAEKLTVNFGNFIKIDPKFKKDELIVQTKIGRL